MVIYNNEEDKIIKASYLSWIIWSVYDLILIDESGEMCSRVVLIVCFSVSLLESNNVESAVPAKCVWSIINILFVSFKLS